MKTIHKKNGGFTLVELIVVIAILAILAAVAIPAYSGYIEKAEKAGDLQLLGAVNQAFASACVANGKDVSEVTSAAIVLEEGKIIGVSVPAEYSDDFLMFYEGNQNAAFKVIKGLAFDALKHVFVDAAEGATVMYGDTYITIDGSAVQDYQNSAWGNVASGDVLQMVTNVTDLAAGIDNDTWENMLEDPAYLAACATAMGYDSVEEWDAAMTALQEKKGAELVASGMDPNSEEYEEAYGAYGSQLMANNTVLVAAKNAQGNSETILGTLTQNGGKDAKDLIKAEMQTNPANGLSQAALTYGLYTSYMMEKDPDFDPSKMENPADALDYLEDTGFQKYLSEGNGKTDLAGYVAALNTAGANTGNGVGADIVENGFAGNAALEALLKQALGG